MFSSWIPDPSLLCIWSSLGLSGIYFKASSYQLRPCSVCEYLFGTSVWFWDHTVSLKLASLCPIPLEIVIVSPETAGSASSPLLWNRGCSLETGWEKPLAWLPQHQAISLELAGLKRLQAVGTELNCLSCKLFKLFASYSFTLGKNLREMGSQSTNILRVPQHPREGLWTILCLKTVVLPHVYF